ncbi:MAG: sigma 54-interacting transcriptional regulator, partial [Planctomycetes bacterium]|nr:sigma 54-interacting transcriptional regulator [Planctomycetota bacterium]
CSAIPSALFEAELFGHDIGAFTGAGKASVGKVRLAEGGTLFLNEIGEVPSVLQAKLLHLLDGHEVYPVGGSTPYRLHARVIAATNQLLSADVLPSGFRRDLFYRLSGGTPFHLVIPPLRNRPSDILLLANHFLATEIQPGQRSPKLDVEASARLMSYSWPGNVRELRKTVLAALALARQAGSSQLEIRFPGSSSLGPASGGYASPGNGMTPFEHEILGILSRTGPMSRAKIAVKLGCCESTMRKVVKTLLGAGIVEAVGAGRASRIRVRAAPEALGRESAMSIR